MKPNAIVNADRGTAFIIFGILFCCYLFTYAGIIQSSDGLAMFTATESLTRRGQADSNQIWWMGIQQASFGRDGDLYARKGVGSTLLALPLAALALHGPALGLVQAVLLLNPLLTAWTGALLYLTARRLGWTRAVAMTAALAFGLATLAWPYTQTFFSDPIAGWGLFAALYGLLRYQASGRWQMLLLAGIAWGLAYLTRALNLITLPLYIAALAGILLSAGHWTKRVAVARHPLSPIGQLLDGWRGWLAFGLPIAAAGAASLAWNWVRYGHLFESGYVTEVERFSGDWLFGIWGLLLSPGRGVFWYSPLLLLALPGTVWLWRRHRIATGLALAVCVSYILAYGKWFMWHGGYCWGPRFLVPLMPLLALLALPALGRLLTTGRRGRAIAGLLLLVSMGVQWLGMAVPFGMVQDYLAATVTPLFAPETFIRPELSPLALQWRFLSGESLSFAWSQTNNWLGFTLPLIGLAVGTALLSGRLGWGDATDRGIARPAAFMLFLIATTLVLLSQYRLPLSSTENAAIATYITREELPGDAILDLRVVETQRFSNVYRGRLPVYGPADTTGVLAPAEHELLTRLDGRHRRLWVIASDVPINHSAWQAALRSRAYLLWEGEPGGRRVALYALPTLNPVPQVELGVEFGTPTPFATLESAGKTSKITRDREILLALRWRAMAPVEDNYHVFVHLRDESGETQAQRDGQPANWLRPTVTWQVGETITDRYGFLLPAGFLPGRYALVVGLYDPTTGERVPAGTASEVLIGYVQVTW